MKDEYGGVIIDEFIALKSMRMSMSTRMIMINKKDNDK